MTDLLPINYLDTGKVARDKINNSFNEVVETVEGYRPHIENGVWYIGNTDTGVKAEGDSISMKVEDGYIWYKSESASWTQIIATSDLKGEQGEPGTPGTPGAPGEDGAAATITVGTTSTGTPGSSASVTNSGTSSAAVLNFVIPAGAKGEPGEDGEDGSDGEAATITVGTTTTLPAGSSATVTNVGTSSAAILNFGIPKGDSGSGSGDVSGPSSATNEDIVLFDGTTGKLIKDGNKKLSDLQEKLTAGTGIDITNNVISATGGGTGDGDMKYEDFERETATGSSITLDLSTEYTPSGNFTINAPATIKDGQVYVLRVNNGATAYTMSLGTNITNLQGTDITLTANAIDMFVFVAIDGELELQKEMPQGGSGDVIGPSSSTNGHLAVFDGTTGKQIKDGGAMPTIPTKTSDLNNDSGFITNSSLSGYQTTANMKTNLTDDSDSYYPTQKAVKTAVDAKQDTLTAGTGIDITNNVISTTGGGGEGNTKTFTLSGTTGATAIAEAQAIYDRYNAGKDPIVMYDGKLYLFSQYQSSMILFSNEDIGTSHYSNLGYSHTKQNKIAFMLSSGTVTSISATSYANAGVYVLATNQNYSTPYTPQYDGSPATKKYVDDNKGIQNDTTGTTSTLTNIWRGTQAEYNLLTPDSNTLYIIS